MSRGNASKVHKKSYKGRRVTSTEITAITQIGQNMYNKTTQNINPVDTKHTVWAKK